jgi:ribosomal protein S18 acetylase RimI-like enzyme
MALPDPRLRPATPADAAALLEFVNFASEGLALYLWQKMSVPGVDAWEVGRRRAMRETGSFSYRNAMLLEERGRAVACLIGYKLPDAPEPIEYATMPPLFVPLQELENLAPGTWYVNVLACYPEDRGKGYGTRLLTEAEERASQSGCGGLSLIVSDSNEGARRLYDRCGYREIARRPMVKEDWKSPGKDWVLLARDL